MFFPLCLKRSPNRRADGDDGGSAPLLIETVSGGAVPSSRIDVFRSLGAKDGGAPFACRRKPVFGDKTDGTSVVSRKVTLADRGVCSACECGTGRSAGDEPAELSSGPMRPASEVPPPPEAGTLRRVGAGPMYEAVGRQWPAYRYSFPREPLPEIRPLRCRTAPRSERNKADSGV